MMNEIAPAAFTNPAQQMPMSFGLIFDRTFRLMRAKFRLFFVIAAIPSAAIFLVIAAIIGLMLMVIGPHIADKSAPPAAFPIYILAIIFCTYLILPLIYALYLPAACYAAMQADHGVTVSFRQAYSVAWRRFGRYLWLMILCALYIIIPVLACTAVIGLVALLLYFAVGSSFGNYIVLLIPLGILFYIALMVYSVLIALRFSLAYPVAVAEGLPAWASLQRSGQLTKGAMGRIFLVLLVVYALTYLVSLVCIALLCAVGAAGFFVAILTHVSQGSHAFYFLIGLGVVGYLLVMAASVMFSYAAFTAALSVIYHDQLLRKGGLQAELSQTGETQV
jgi:hypothetical protein